MVDNTATIRQAMDIAAKKYLKDVLPTTLPWLQRRNWRPVTFDWDEGPLETTASDDGVVAKTRMYLNGYIRTKKMGRMPLYAFCAFEGDVPPGKLAIVLTINKHGTRTYAIASP